MTPERWQQIDQLFHSVLAHESSERAAFLAQACNGDESLRQEVESLIGSHEQSESFIEEPAADIAAGLLAGKEAKLTAGQAVGPYKIESLLGEGGMGEVYLADDTRLNRKIALKVLPPHFTDNPARVRRFEQEARAASALSHPNIVTIYEIGQSNSAHFIATEFVDGKTLRQLINEKPFTLIDTLNVAIQVAGALAGAHAVGVVHRDIKPDNIMVRADGYVKVLDFGLAKLTELHTTDAELETPTLLQSNPGLVMGTVQYMSPEQARGKKVDARTDIWSLGIVLYELLTGRVPFSGETPSHVMVSLMEDELPALTQHANVPPELDRIVTRALRKNQKERYQGASQLSRDLKNLKRELQVEAGLKGFLEAVPSRKGRTTKSGGQAVGPVPASATRTVDIGVAHPTASAEYLVGEIKRHKTFAGAALLILLVGAIGLTYVGINRHKANLGASGKKSIAVLPLKPINAANRDEIYEVGIADSLINRLGSVKGFVVRPLSATRKYADLAQDPIAAGKEQQVDYVLASNYQVVGGKIRVTAQLFDVASGRIEETYKSESDAANVFAMQDAIAGAFANKLLTRFGATAGRPAAKRGTTNEEAYRLYLHGKNLTDRRSVKDALKAVEYFEQAIRLDPNYALAFARMADAYVALAILGGGSPGEEYEKARAAVNKALELDNNLAEAYSTRADIKYGYEWDFNGAEKDVERALQLDPNCDASDRPNWLAHRGRFNEAIAAVEKRLEIDPNSIVFQRDRGRILYLARRYDEAIAELKRVIELDENFGTAYGLLWQAYETTGDYAGAYETFINHQKRTNPEQAKVYQKAYEIGGWQEVRRKFLEFSKLDENKPKSNLFVIARQYARLGDKEQALVYLNKAVEKRNTQVLMLNVDPAFDILRDDPRFAELIRRVGLK